MWPAEQHHHILGASPIQLRPTQITVGYAEVREKRREWAALGRHKRRENLEHQMFPAVLGPKQKLYIIDHHHLGLALIEERVKKVWVALFDDLSYLTTDVFWRTMEFRAWTHPYDSSGQRCSFVDVPRRLTDMQDDPYRSLAGLVRVAGGYAKSTQPFAEFLWADFLRSRVTPSLIRREPRRAVNAGVKLARTSEARYLPGWSGSVDDGG